MSIVEINQGVIEVRASHGNAKLGGDDFDELLANHLAAQFLAMHGVDPRGDRRALARLSRPAEQAKIVLPDQPYVRVTEEYLASEDSVTPLHLDVELARTAFEDLIQPLVESTFESVDRALDDADLQRGDLDLMLLCPPRSVPSGE